MGLAMRTWVRPQAQGVPDQHADVPGAVAQQGEGLLGDGGEDQLALGAVGQDLAGVGVDDLGDEVVLTDVHAVLLGALEGDAGAGKLGQAINIIGLDAQLVLDVAAHLLGPGLGAEDAGLELDLIPQAALVDGLGQDRRRKRGCSRGWWSRGHT